MFEIAVLGLMAVAVIGGLAALTALVRSQRTAMDRLVDSNRTLVEALVAVRYPESAELLARARAMSAELNGAVPDDEPVRTRI